HLQVQARVRGIEMAATHLLVDVVHQREAAAQVRRAPAEGAEHAGERRHDLVEARQDGRHRFARRHGAISERHECVGIEWMALRSNEHVPKERLIDDGLRASELAGAKWALEMLHDWSLGGARLAASQMETTRALRKRKHNGSTSVVRKPDNWCS